MPLILEEAKAMNMLMGVLVGLIKKELFINQFVRVVAVILIFQLNQIQELFL